MYGRRRWVGMYMRLAGYDAAGHDDHVPVVLLHADGGNMQLHEEHPEVSHMTTGRTGCCQLVETIQALVASTER